MKNHSLLFLSVLFVVSLSACSTMNKLNPFSSEDKNTVSKPTKVKCDAPKVKQVQCYAWDHAGMCTVW